MRSGVGGRGYARRTDWRTWVGAALTTSETRTTQGESRDDPGAGVDFGLEDLNEVLAGMVGEVAQERARDAELITCRLGLDGESPETLMLLGARFGVSRDRARQLYTRAVGVMVRQALATGVPDLSVFAQRYPYGRGDERLVRILLAETYATDTDIAAQDWSYLKLRLAGHDLQDAKRLAGFVFQRIAGWQQKGRWHLMPTPHPEDASDDVWNPWLKRVEWGAGTPAELPALPAGRIDYDDDGRGRVFSEKLGREVTFDTGLQARLLRQLDTSPRVRTFRELPAAVTYEVDGTERVHYPTVAAQFTDDRVVLFDVAPLAHMRLPGTARPRRRRTGLRARARLGLAVVDRQPPGCGGPDDPKGERPPRHRAHQPPRDRPRELARATGLPRQVRSGDAGPGRPDPAPRLALAPRPVPAEPLT